MTSTDIKVLDNNSYLLKNSSAQGWVIFRNETEGATRYTFGAEENLTEDLASVYAAIFCKSLPPVKNEKSTESKTIVAFQISNPHEHATIQANGKIFPLQLRGKSINPNDILRTIQEKNTLELTCCLANPVTKQMCEKIFNECTNDCLLELFFKTILHSNLNFFPSYDLSQTLCQALKIKNIELFPFLGYVSGIMHDDIKDKSHLLLDLAFRVKFDDHILQIAQNAGMPTESKECDVGLLELSALLGAVETTFRLVKGINDAQKAIAALCQCRQPIKTIGSWKWKDRISWFHETWCKRKPTTNYQDILTQLLSLYPNLDPLTQEPKLLERLIVSPLISQDAKVKMISLLLERHERILQSDKQSSTDRVTWMNVVNEEGHSLLATAVASDGTEELLKKLIEWGSDPRYLDREGNTLLHHAARANNLDALHLFLQSNVEKLHANAQHLTALDVTASLNYVNQGCIAAMINGEIPFTLDESAKTDLVKGLARIGSLTEISLLLKKFPSPNLIKTLYATYAIRWSMVELIELALQLGEDLKDFIFNETPILITCVCEGHFEAASKLIQIGVPCNIRWKGVTARRLLLDRISELKQLEKCEIDSIPPAQIPQSNRETDLLKLMDVVLLKQASDFHDQTPFHAAAAQGDIAVCRRFTAIESWLPYDVERQTPLHEAIKRGHKEIVMLFLDALSQGKLKNYSAQQFHGVLRTRYITDILKPAEDWRTTFCRFTLGGGFLATALACNQSELANLIYDQDPVFERGENPEQIFDILYNVALTGSLIAFKNAIEWLSARTQLKREAVLASICAKNSPALRWVLERKPELKSNMEVGIDLAIHYQTSDILQILVDHEIGKNKLQVTLFAKLMKSGDYLNFGILLGAVILDEYHKTIVTEMLQNQNSKFLHVFIRRKSVLSEKEAESVLQKINQQFKHYSNMPPSVLFYLISQSRGIAEWLTIIEEVGKIHAGFTKELQDIVEPELFFSQIFSEIFGKFQQGLAREPNILNRLFAILKQIKNKQELALFFNALQCGCPLAELEQALLIATEIQQSGLITLERYINLPEAKKMQVLLYFAAFGSRAGYKICFYELKRKGNADILALTLKGLESIGMPLAVKKIEKYFPALLENPNASVRCQTVRALWKVQPNEYFIFAKKLLNKALEDAQAIDEALYAIIDVLGFYEYDDTNLLDRKIVDNLMRISFYQDKLVRRACARTLARICIVEALIRAAEIVQSDDWDYMKEQFGEDRKFYQGHWSLFMYRPEFHDSRSAMLSRIQEQLAFALKGTISTKVDQRFTQFKQKPESDFELSKLVNDLAHIPPSSRYIPIPIFYPEIPGHYLMRGLKARKGDVLFRESIRDLIRKGCGTSDLSYFDAYDYGSWSKIGHMFASHTSKVVSFYFDVDDGCLILFDPAYYNKQYRKRMARTEHEGSINNVLYQGIPKNAIKLIYLSNTFKEDIERLNSDKPIDDKFKSKLTSGVFNNCSLPELLQLRRFLHEPMEAVSMGQEPLLIHGKTVHRTFYDCFRFIEPKEDISLRFSKDTVKEITREQIDEVTVKIAIAKQIVREKCAKDKGIEFFLTPDQMLTHLTDDEFKQSIPKKVSVSYFPYSFTSFANVPCGHGHKADNSPVNLIEHTLDVICGNFGGFGLKTTLSTTSCKGFQLRKVLRLAALFHDSGKLQGRHDHVARSAEITEKALTSSKEWDVTPDEKSLIIALILHNDIYGEYLKRRSIMQPSELIQKLNEAYLSSQLKESVISQFDFRKLLFALWIADASTLSIVNKVRVKLYRPLFDKLDSLNFQTLQELIDTKRALETSAQYP